MAGGLLCGFLVGYLMSAIVDFLQKLWEFHVPSAEAKTQKIKAQTQVRRGAFHRCGPEGIGSVAQLY